MVDDFETAGGGERHQAFADRHGVECDTFRRWLYLLRAEGHGRRWPLAKTETPVPPLALPLVEMQPVHTPDGRFEIELPDGFRIHVPTTFEAEALRRLLAILTDKSSS